MMSYTSITGSLPSLQRAFGGSRGRAAGLATLALVVGMPSGSADLGAQERCDDGRISEVRVRTLDPYDEDSASEDAAFGWAFRALNWLHVETREAVVSWELLFSEGSCFDPLRLRESERSLRALPFLRSASVTSESLEDGTHRVKVTTRDAWALSASLTADFEDGLDVTGVQGSHRNVLGSGLRASLFRRAFRERLRSGVLVRHTNLFGSRIESVTHGGRTRAGDYVSQTLERPFSNEFADHAFRQVAGRRDDYFGYSLSSGTEDAVVYLRHQTERLELAYQTRLGPVTGERLIVGLALSSESFSTPAAPADVRTVIDGDFSETVEAPASIGAEIVAQAAPYSTRRVSFVLGLRNARFETRGGVDAIEAPQDLFVGRDVTLTVGPGFSIWGAADSDVLTRLKGRVGVLGPSWYLLARADLHGRRVTGATTGPGGWRDVVGVARVDGYWTQRDWASLYARGRVTGGWSTDRPFQLGLGGREGIRAYGEGAFPGGRLAFGSVEQRLSLDAVSPSFAELGAAVFVDAGRMWAGDAPFGLDSGWHSGMGFGLRASAAGARRVFRADVALPLTGPRAGREVVLRLYGELFGVLERRRWPDQVQRSRWYGSDPDLSGRVADPLARN